MISSARYHLFPAEDVNPQQAITAGIRLSANKPPVPQRPISSPQRAVRSSDDSNFCSSTGYVCERNPIFNSEHVIKTGTLQ